MIHQINYDLENYESFFDFYTFKIVKSGLLFDQL